MRVTLIAAVAVLLACIVFLALVRSGEETVGAPTSAQAPAQLPPSLPQPLRGDDFLGVVLPREAVELSARFDGRLESVAVQVGDRVKAGTEVARMALGMLQSEE